MSYVTPDGNWEIPESSDQPYAQLFPMDAANLCMRCGVRIWTRDMPLHDDWHSSTDIRQ